MRAFGIDIASRFDKVLCTQDTDILHRINLVYVMVSGIDHGDGHALPLESGFMQFLAIAGLYLPESGTIIGFAPGRTVHQRVAFIFRSRFRRGNPHLLRSAHKRQRSYFAYHSTVVARYGDKIIPFSGDYDLHSLVADGIHILTAYGQIGRIDGQLLTLAAGNRLF